MLYISERERNRNGKEVYFFFVAVGEMLETHIEWYERRDHDVDGTYHLSDNSNVVRYFCVVADILAKFTTVKKRNSSLQMDSLKIHPFYTIN